MHTAILPHFGAGTTDDAQASSRDVSADVENEPCVSEAGSISAAVLRIHLSIPSGKHTKNYGKSPFFMGKSTINGHFQ